MKDELLALARRKEGLGHIPFDDRGVFSEEAVVLLQQRHWNTAESKAETGIVTHPESKTRICAWARIDNREELTAKLPHDLQPLAAGDAGLILAVYLKYGGEFCEQLIGDFAFAIHDHRDDSITLGRDHMGVRPLYYHWNGRDFVFATSLAVLDELASLKLGIDENWIARALLGKSADWKRTPFLNTFKVAPAHTIRFHGSEPTQKRYFEFSSASELRLKSDDEYVAAYREKLEEAVRCRVRSDYPVATESSGGLDASSCTAFAAQLMEHPTRDLTSIGWALHEFEPAAITSIGEMWPHRGTELVTDLDHLQDTKPQWLRYWQAFGAANEMQFGFGYFPFYERVQKLGARTLLSGFGGDEFVTTNAAMARVEFLENRQYGKIARTMRGNPLFAWLRTWKWILNERRNNGISEMSRSMTAYAEAFWGSRITADRLATDEMKELVCESAGFDRGYQTLNDFTLGNRWSPAVTARMEGGSMMAASYGVEYRWPMLDVRLLKFFLSVPAEQKLGPQGVSRYLHRRAVADLLPENIVWNSKDMGKSVVDMKKPLLTDPLRAESLDPAIIEIVDDDRLKDLLHDQQSTDDRMKLSTLRYLGDVNDWLKFRRSR